MKEGGVVRGKVIFFVLTCKGTNKKGEYQEKKREFLGVNEKNFDYWKNENSQLGK